MIIDQEFKDLIPPLSADEFKQLEENILRDGIRDSVTYWDNNGDHILIDGHNRWEIAQKHNLPINERRMTFNSLDEVIQWIILNQFGRRNLSAYDRSILALKLKPVIAQQAKQNQVDAGGAVHQKSDKAVNTNKELAYVAGVSHDTIHKVETILEKGTPKMQELCQKGEMSVNAAYSMIKGAERETRQKREAAELREAEKRHKELAEQKAEGVVSIDAVRQDKEDSVLIFNGFKEDIRLMGNKVLTLGGQLSRDEIKDVLRCGSMWDLRELEQTLSNYASIITRTRRAIEEVYHEKQSNGAV